MLNNIQLHNYQKKMCLFAILHKNCILSVDMGLGKTLTMLYLLKLLEPKRAIIIAPKRVSEYTWINENDKWQLGLDIISIKGTKKQRQKLINEKHCIIVVSRENIEEIIGDYDLLIIDELTSYKNIESQRTKSILKINAERKIGLTGTLCANGLIDIYAQSKVCGLSFNNQSFKEWRAHNFVNVMENAPVKWSKWEPRFTMEQIIKPIKDYTYTLTADDYLKIPQITYNNEEVELSEEEYNEITNLDAFLSTEFGDGTDILTIDEKAKFVKLQTFANGFIYNENDEAIYRGESTKLNAVADYIIRMNEKGENVLLFYAYKYEVIVLTDLLKKAKITPNLITEKEIINKWNNGEVSVLMAHPASAGHGLNLQQGGRVVVWSTLTYNYELFAQGNARLARQGQTQRTIITTFIAKNTCEEKIYKALQIKNETQKNFQKLTKNKEGNNYLCNDIFNINT